MEAHDEEDDEEEEKIVTTQNLFHIQYSTSLEQRICVVYAAERIWNYVDWKLKFQLCYILLIPSHSGCCQAPYIIYIWEWIQKTTPPAATHKQLTSINLSYRVSNAELWAEAAASERKKDKSFDMIEFFFSHSLQKKHSTASQSLFEMWIIYIYRTKEFPLFELQFFDADLTHITSSLRFNPFLVSVSRRPCANTRHRVCAQLPFTRPRETWA